MNENVIFVINYILYSAFSSTLFIAELYVFDFKISRLRYALRCFICIMPLSTLKFVLPVDSVVGVCTIPVIQMLVIVLLITSVNGNIFKNIFIHLIFSFVSTFSSLLWFFIPNGDATNYEIGTTLGYLYNFPLIIVLYIATVIIIRKIESKNLMYSSMATFVSAIMMVYSIMITLVASKESVFAYKSVEYIAPLIINVIVILGIIIFLMVFMSKKSSELELKSHLTRLETARSLEEESYRRTLERIEAMAKLRHDFYGQLQAARYLLEADPEEGRKMLEDMMIALPKQK